MGEFARKSDGRRVFTAEFKRSTVERIRNGDTTLATTARELDIQPTVIRRWMKLAEGGSTAAVQAGEEVVPISRVRELEKQVRELQRLVGKQAMTIEILEAAREVVKKRSTLVQRVQAVTAHPTSAVCRALRVSRSTAYLRPQPRPGPLYRRAEDREVLLAIMSVVRDRASYGVRRVHALVNRGRRRLGVKPYNRKRIRRVMRMNKLTLPGKVRRRDRPHTGQVRMPASNQRWCSDGFNIRCWNGDLVPSPSRSTATTGKPSTSWPSPAISTAPTSGCCSTKRCGPASENVS